NSILKAVGEKNIAEAGADDGPGPHLLQSPNGSLARRAAAEIRTGHQDLRLPIGLAVQDEGGILRTVGQIAQRTERPFSERAANRISDQALNADDDVGIDIAPHDRRGDGGQLVEGFRHGQRPIVRTSAIAPAMAAAAALAGLARCVRARGPWRPTKFRFEVEMERWPGPTVSPLAARHI